MRTIWQSLAWKEWHEHKWKLVSLVAVLWGVTFLPLLDLERGTLTGIQFGLIMGIAPLAVFVGLGTAAGERSRGTLRFLQALPVPMWRVALHKLAFGLITVLVPALLTIALILAWTSCLDLLGIDYKAASDFSEAVLNGNAPFLVTSNWTANTALMVCLVGTNFYVWTIAFGVNRKDEVSAGAVALAAICVWWAVLTMAWSMWLRYFPDQRVSPSWLAAAGFATAPGGLIPLFVEFRQFGGDIRLVAFGLGVGTITHLALAGWYVRRYGRISNLEVRSPKSAVRGAGIDWLGMPRRSPLTAIVWKQFRECLPLVLVGLAIVVSTAAIIWLGDSRSAQFGGVYAAASNSMGIAVAMIVGIGVFHSDVGPRQNEFWRSRPIQTDLWFWTKFLSGLAILLAAIYGPILLIAFAGDDSGLAGPAHLETPVFLAIHIAIFAAAVAMTCLVRHAVYAAILSIAMVYFGILVVLLALVIGRLFGWLQRPPENLVDLTDSQGITGLLISFMACSLLAWLAVRNDWGQKSVR